jgi:hypothetical protein
MAQMDTAKNKNKWPQKGARGIKKKLPGCPCASSQTPFAGQIDEVRIWSTAGTCDEMSQLKNCERAGKKRGGFVLQVQSWRGRQQQRGRDDRD